MTRPQRYRLDVGWTLILAGLGLKPADVLRAADLPQDLLTQDQPSLTTDGYFRLWEALDRLTDDPDLPLRLTEAMPPDAFSPALFACLCSPSLNSALDRLATYKHLIGPMTLRVDRMADATTVTLAGLPDTQAIPPSLIGAELAFFVNFARIGTRDHIVPRSATSTTPMPTGSSLAQWIGCPVTLADCTSVTFRADDAQRPFLTASPAMWAAFEPSLRQRLSEIEHAASMTERLQAWLNETIASGRTSIQDAASDLGVSTRTLQRRLSDEGTSFQAQLSLVRERLAQHYLRQTRLSTPEIAFLLGYAETNSFYRAFQLWTGTSPDAARSIGP